MMKLGFGGSASAASGNECGVTEGNDATNEKMQTTPGSGAEARLVTIEM